MTRWRLEPTRREEAPMTRERSEQWTDPRIVEWAAGVRATTATPPDALRAALSDAVKRASLDEVADAFVAALEDGTFADATEAQLRHAVYELVARAALASPQPEAPVALDVERLAEALVYWDFDDQDGDHLTMRPNEGNIEAQRPDAERLLRIYVRLAAEHQP